MENEIESYFSQMYHQKDTTNKNKFKFGKMFTENDNTIVIIYGKPRGNYFNRHFGPAELYTHTECKNPNILNFKEFKENTSCGGFRIKWNVTNNTYQYICATRMIPCGCNVGNPVLYFSPINKIAISEKYLSLVSIIEMNKNKN